MNDDAELTHLDADGHVRMVDVSSKAPTARRAVAAGRVRVAPCLAEAIAQQRLPKGDALEVARIAGIQAAKRTDYLIPLCHSLALESVAVELELREGAIEIRAEVKTLAKTGVEMEALTAVAVAALTIVDMGKSMDRSMVIEGIRVLHKSGGRRGSYEAPPPTGDGVA